MTLKGLITKAIDRAKELGCKVEEDAIGIVAFSPDGKHFSASDAHSVKITHANDYCLPMKMDRVTLALDDMEDGLEECPPDCECRTEDEGGTQA